MLFRIPVNRNVAYVCLIVISKGGGGRNNISKDFSQPLLWSKKIFFSCLINLLNFLDKALDAFHFILFRFVVNSAKEIQTLPVSLAKASTVCNFVHFWELNIFSFNHY